MKRFQIVDKTVILEPENEQMMRGRFAPSRKRMRRTIVYVRTLPPLIRSPDSGTIRTD